MGETLSGYFADGSEIFVEHINHDPPIDFFMLINNDQKFTVTGKPVTSIQLGTNEVKIMFKSIIKADFEGDTIYVQPAGILDKGLIFGKMRISCFGQFIFYYPKAGLKALVRIGVKGQLDQLAGAIYKCCQ